MSPYPKSSKNLLPHTLPVAAPFKSPHQPTTLAILSPTRIASSFWILSASLHVISSSFHSLFIFPHLPAYWAVVKEPPVSPFSAHQRECTPSNKIASFVSRFLFWLGWFSPPFRLGDIFDPLHPVLCSTFAQGVVLSAVSPLSFGHFHVVWHGLRDLTAQLLREALCTEKVFQNPLDPDSFLFAINFDGEDEVRLCGGDVCAVPSSHDSRAVDVVSVDPPLFYGCFERGFRGDVVQTENLRHHDRAF